MTGTAGMTTMGGGTTATVTATSTAATTMTTTAGAATRAIGCRRVTAGSAAIATTGRCTWCATTAPIACARRRAAITGCAVMTASTCWWPSPPASSWTPPCTDHGQPRSESEAAPQGAAFFYPPHRRTRQRAATHNGSRCSLCLYSAGPPVQDGHLGRVPEPPGTTVTTQWGGSDAAAVWRVDRIGMCGDSDPVWRFFGALDPGAIGGQ